MDGDNGGYLLFESRTPLVCSVSEPTRARRIRAASGITATVNFLAAGICTLKATQSASGGHTVATPVTRSFLVTVPAPPPTPPSPANLTSTGIGGAAQTGTVTLAAGNTVRLLNGSSPTRVAVTGGVYTLAGNVITFTPAAGFTGAATPVTFRVTDTASLTGDAIYTPTVVKPPAPAPSARVSSGPGVQTATVGLALGETITLRSATGDPTGSVTVTGQGSYSLNAATGVITFTPVEGFLGAGDGVRFRVSDTYEQFGEATYTPTVTEETPTPTPTPTPTETPKPPAPEPLPEIDRTKHVKIPDDPKSVKGKEKKTKAFNSSFSGIDAHPITKLGDRILVKGEAATLSGDGLFRFDSGKLTKKGRAMVKAVVFNLEGSKSVNCEGYTDYAGEIDHELDLSLRRAKVVCAALKRYGADVKTKTDGYGPKRPAVVGGSAKSRKENRRVVIVVLN
jgi:CshA-type fibril repeat protein